MFSFLGYRYVNKGNRDYFYIKSIDQNSQLYRNSSFLHLHIMFDVVST